MTADRGAGGPVVLVLAADDGFARYLAVALRSVIRTLEPGAQLVAYVLDMGIEAAGRQLIASVAAAPGVELRWVSTVKDRVSTLPNSWPLITPATYARLYIPLVLDPARTRAVYLDCDVLVRRSLTELFATDMGGHSALAVGDAQSPLVSSPFGVPWWFAQGRDAGERNVNAGVLLIDVDAWRRDDVASAAVDYLMSDRYGFGQDQEAINVVLAGRIGELDGRWNQQAELARPEFSAIQPWPRATVEQVLADPWIVHFSGEHKPWHHGYAHEHLAEWQSALDETPLAGWRPSRAAASAAHAQRLVKRAWREVRPGA